MDHRFLALYLVQSQPKMFLVHHPQPRKQNQVYETRGEEEERESYQSKDHRYMTGHGYTSECTLDLPNVKSKPKNAETDPNSTTKNTTKEIIYYTQLQ
jgi:hypothetical protein